MLNLTLSDLTLECTSGPLTFKDLLGRYIVFYFYPKDNTPGCTTQASEFSERMAAFKQLNSVVLGCSRDSLASHEKFMAKFELQFDLVSDKSEAICQAFDVMKNKMMYGKAVRGIERSTFIIDPKGKLVREWRGVKVAGHVEEVLTTLQSIVK